MNTIISEYFNAFKNKNITTIDNILSQDVILQDPVVGQLTKRQEVIKAYKDIFENCHQIQFETKRSYQMNENSFAIEFSFKFVDNSGAHHKVDGVDLIDISDVKITSIRAYLDTNTN
jgi:hypothetical protein